MTYSDVNDLSGRNEEKAQTFENCPNVHQMATAAWHSRKHGRRRALNFDYQWGLKILRFIEPVVLSLRQEDCRADVGGQHVDQQWAVVEHFAWLKRCHLPRSMKIRQKKVQKFIDYALAFLESRNGYWDESEACKKYAPGRRKPLCRRFSMTCCCARCGTKLARNTTSKPLWACCWYYTFHLPVNAPVSDLIGSSKITNLRKSEVADRRAGSSDIANIP